MLNDDLKHIQVGRDVEVPIESNNSLWFLWIKKSGEWDSERITRASSIIKEISKKEVSLVFCCWHGQYKTNLFLMGKDNLIKRLEGIISK